MKLGVAGIGKIGREALEVLHELGIVPCSLFARPQRRQEAQALAATYGIERCDYDYDAFLQGPIDTVYLALTNSVHFEFAKAALLQGKHVIVEKPITVTVRELDELCALAERKHVMLFEAMTVHHLPAYQSMRRELPRLGTVKIVNLNFSQYSSRYEAFLRGEILPVFDYRKAGGALMDLNIYNIHAALGLFGMPQEIEYRANLQNRIDTSGILTMDYGSFQAVCIGAKDCEAPCRSVIQGTDGCILTDESLNGVGSYVLRLRGEEERQRSFARKHRLAYEFLAIAQILAQSDFAQMRRLLELSRCACRLMEQAREQAGLCF